MWAQSFGCSEGLDSISDQGELSQAMHSRLMLPGSWLFAQINIVPQYVTSHQLLIPHKPTHLIESNHPGPDRCNTAGPVIIESNHPEPDTCNTAGPVIIESNHPESDGCNIASPVIIEPSLDFTGD